MPAEIIDGIAIAAKVRARVAEDTAALKKRGVTPGLTAVLVGEDPASSVYVASKERACKEAGMNGRSIRLPASTTEEALLAVIDTLNNDPTVHGILVQMPVPKQISEQKVIRRIAQQKDVDGFHPFNVGKVFTGDVDGFAPCTPAGVQVMLAEAGVETSGKDAVIIGRSNIVGKPMAALLLQSGKTANCTVTLCHSKTRDLASHTRRADILIAAIGKPEMVTADMVKPGAVVIDVGINRVEDPSAPKGYRIVGDVHFESVREVASKISPVPGGVGRMTIAMLLANTVRAAQLTLEG
ncbi:MAG: bifunctional 5,10-methylenetetrahydrofolate dehydrogenase/5,10-methenyltetrahydrofolate cyclohydrolase [Gemmatimonadota bacterium]|nr:bifunctional 5,10-methylenetetrahydrofolate dehydrogenase/5,10-methenyltetrahydrofolate cyclohydrolase [Gemmatimonadota bacterium]